jgi:hypothetical protein
MYALSFFFPGISYSTYSWEIRDRHLRDESVNGPFSKAWNGDNVGTNLIVLG